jgi:hypothetical protein
MFDLLGLAHLTGEALHGVQGVHVDPQLDLRVGAVAAAVAAVLQARVVLLQHVLLQLRQQKILKNSVSYKKMNETKRSRLHSLGQPFYLKNRF